MERIFFSCDWESTTKYSVHDLWLKYSDTVLGVLRIHHTSPIHWNLDYFGQRLMTAQRRRFSITLGILI